MTGQFSIFAVAPVLILYATMTSEDCQLAHTSKQLFRAKRIPDAEWDEKRARLVELYMEKDASRKEVIETMAQEHSFIITYRFLCPFSLARADHKKRDAIEASISVMGGQKVHPSPGYGSDNNIKDAT